MRLDLRAVSRTGRGRGRRPARSKVLAAPVLVLAASLPGCSQLPVPARAPGPPAATVAGELPEATQTLFRVSYDGPAGHGGLRLVLRQAAADRFQLLASDTLGRAAWSLDHDGAEVLMVDHRERLYCVAGSELRVPELALAPLPLESLPRVLAGGTPVAPPADSAAAKLDWVDDAGRHWSAVLADGAVHRWTLWEGGEPQLWWQRRGRGGILSHRRGSQFRWRRVVQERLAGADYRRLAPPAEYDLGGCPEGSAVDPAATP